MGCLSGSIKLIDRYEYKCNPITKGTSKQKSISVIGIDTETKPTGECFLICTSLREAYKFEDFPGKFFGRHYKNKVLVAYNLSFDEGSLLQFLNKENLKELWKTGKTEYQDYIIKCIPKKMLKITKNKKDSITVYDMLNFYQGAGENGSSSLDSVAKKVLGDQKIKIQSKTFTDEYIKNNWKEIVDYCIQDAILVERLGNLIIHHFEEWGVKIRALYSIAYVTFQYFSRFTNYVTVKKYWEKHKSILNASLEAFSGGKFEITRKGYDYYYIYDIVSAYPYEISNLKDITNARVVYDKYYHDDADYSFYKCILKLNDKTYSPVSQKWGSLCTYPVGTMLATITKTEYDYLLKYGNDIQIIDAQHIFCTRQTYPYRDKIYELMKFKKQYKEDKNYMMYHISKIFLNSLYGKMVQSIPNGEKLRASTCWNPIYGAYITANTRVRVSEMQQLYPSVVAVFTDSAISTQPLPIQLGKNIGEWDLETHGRGLILGCGVYQVGCKTKIRGFHSNTQLYDLANRDSDTIPITSMHAVSWREVAFHNWEKSTINLFTEAKKEMKIQMDKKRIWIKDYTRFSEVFERKVYSVPHYVTFFQHS